MASTRAPIFDSGTPLIALAEQGRLPRHQYMDHTTLNWIISNRPETALTPYTAGFRWSELRPLTVPAEWFAAGESVDGIHGVRHCGRVSALAGLLAQLANRTAAQVDEARLAGALHDCRRMHDKDDAGHGSRAAVWFRQHRGAVTTHFPGLAQVRTDVVAAALCLHDVAYAAFDQPQSAAYATDPALCDLVKAADALDRYRLPKLKWWPQPEYLRTAVPPWLHTVAFDYLVATESARIHGMGAGEALYAEPHRSRPWT